MLIKMILEHLNKLSSWDNILPQTKRKIANSSLLSNFDEETILFRESESISQIYLILYGLVISSRISLNGKEKYLYYLSQEDFVNLCTIDGRITSTRAKTLKGTTLIEIEKDILVDLMEGDFNLNLLILHSLTLEVRRCQRQILNMGTYSSDQRIASKLWKLFKDYGKQQDGKYYIDLPITQTDLAHMIGTTRETVNRFLAELASKEIIHLEGNEISIVDKNILLEYIY